MEIDLSKIKKIFFIGIGGIGISALAKMALSRGVVVSGVNDEEGKTIDSLKEAGAEIIFLKDFKDLPKADMYVYSDAWLYRGPEILEQAKQTGKPVLNYFGALGEFANGYKVIAISGTHGKTTTTAMVSEVLVDAGLDPTVIVGSFVKKFGSNFRKGGSEYMVVEADEYNRHFLSLHPFISVINNIDADHLDCYKDLDDIKVAFRQFMSQTTNFLIYNGIRQDISLNEGLNIKQIDYTKYLSKVPHLLVPGEHNRSNASVALAIADLLHIPEEKAKKTLEEFSGTWRRLEKRGETPAGTIIYDDYAHHPTEIKASLQALRELYPKGENNIIVLFQPHLYSRTKALFDDFVRSFEDADQVLLLPIYYAREDPDPSISSEKLAKTIINLGQKARSFGSFAEAESFVGSLSLGSGDIFVTMGAGEAYKVADKVLKFV